MATAGKHIHGTGLKFYGIGVAGAIGVAAMLSVPAARISSSDGVVTITGTGSIRAAAPITAAESTIGAVGSGSIVSQRRISGSGIVPVTGGNRIVSSGRIFHSRGGIDGIGGITSSSARLTGYWIEPVTGSGAISSTSSHIQGYGVVTMPAGTGKAWIMNTESAGHGVYTNYPFASMFRLGADYFGVIEGAGVYKLAGTTDAGTEIPWQAISATTDFGVHTCKYVHDAYCNIRTTGDVLLRTIVDEQHDVGDYVMEADENPGIHRRRFKLGKGLKGTSWQINIRGQAATVLQKLELVPISSSRSS